MTTRIPMSRASMPRLPRWRPFRTEAESISQIGRATQGVRVMNIGDYIELEDGERGLVQEIGPRAERLSSCAGHDVQDGPAQA